MAMFKFLCAVWPSSVIFPSFSLTGTLSMSVSTSGHEETDRSTHNHDHEINYGKHRRFTYQPPTFEFTLGSLYLTSPCTFICQFVFLCIQLFRGSDINSSIAYYFFFSGKICNSPLSNFITHCAFSQTKLVHKKNSGSLYQISTNKTASKRKELPGSIQFLFAVSNEPLPAHIDAYSLNNSSDPRGSNVKLYMFKYCLLSVTLTWLVCVFPISLVWKGSGTKCQFSIFFCFV